MRILSTVAAACLAAGSATAQSDDNLEKLGAFKTTGVTDFKTVEQGGDRAESIRKILDEVELPDGFAIDLYAIVPDARHMAVGPQGLVTFVGTRKTEVWAVTDRDKDRVADEVKNFAPSVAKTIPNGPCFGPTGVLYVAEQNRVLAYPAAEFFFESPDVVATPVIAGGELIPPDEESYNHTARVCKVGPDGKLYVALGQPFNVPPDDKLELYNEWGIGGVIRVNTDGTEREVYTHGVRNSVGNDFHPETDEFWFTDNQVDGMGDEIPPGEVNRQTSAGQNFGFPWYGGGDVRTEDYKGEEPPSDVVMPVAETTAHAANLGMAFYDGDMFPEKYKNGVFIAQHGSWNRTEPVGARILFGAIQEDGSVSVTPFAEGWLKQSTGEYLGRPVDVAQLPDGSILVSDDQVGALYRISYEGS